MDTYTCLSIYISISIYIKLNQSLNTLGLILAFSYCLSELLIGSAGKESAHNEGDLGLIPGWEDPLEKGTATTPVFWPGEFHGLCNPRGRKESDTTERFLLSHSNSKYT